MKQVIVTMKRLNECTYDQGLQLWNEGFTGYFSDMTRNLEQHLAHMSVNGIQPHLSVVAYADAQPIGFVLIAVRTVRGKKLAWNGGTGVAPSCRGQGIAKAMMEEAIRLIREEGVHTAYLEVVAQNDNAIRAYRHVGFQITDRLIGMRHDGGLDANAFKLDPSDSFSLHWGKPVEAADLSFYKEAAAWSSQWHNIREGHSLIVHDSDGSAVAYALYKQVTDDYGKLKSLVLYQCEVAAGRADKDALYRAMLSEVYGPNYAECDRMVYNVSFEPELISLLLEAGFTTIFEQNLMVLEQE
ncbi:GNAT family N-acetyltransferase [Paenibacillus profundus]|uniref:GNAT family N-acetyltransferase n=1 Tax=Paenibacillus profundus TaxID=1173085 RepID=A0ABS8YKK1_9BACL|nr:GNAT family N-acetyltransferase [Paenibacillus profundus]MCE5170782.1 GNAT family N-acetyltransferase [Paenibacillus profundus]